MKIIQYCESVKIRCTISNKQIVKYRNLCNKSPIVYGQKYSALVKIYHKCVYANNASDSNTYAEKANLDVSENNLEKFTVFKDTGMRITLDDRKMKIAPTFKRIITGLILGIFGFVIVLTGGFVYTIFVSAMAYLISREFNALILAIYDSKSLYLAPPHSIRELLNVFCLLFPLLTQMFPAEGKPAFILILGAFIVLFIEVFTIKKPKFSQMSIPIFGLFYCGR